MSTFNFFLAIFMLIGMAGFLYITINIYNIVKKLKEYRETLYFKYARECRTHFRAYVKVFSDNGYGKESKLLNELLNIAIIEDNLFRFYRNKKELTKTIQKWEKLNEHCTSFEKSHPFTDSPKEMRHMLREHSYCISDNLSKMLALFS